MPTNISTVYGIYPVVSIKTIPQFDKTHWSSLLFVLVLNRVSLSIFFGGSTCDKGPCSAANRVKILKWSNILNRSARKPTRPNAPISTGGRHLASTETENHKDANPCGIVCIVKLRATRSFFALSFRRRPESRAHYHKNLCSGHVAVSSILRTKERRFHALNMTSWDCVMSSIKCSRSWSTNARFVPTSVAS